MEETTIGEALTELDARKKELTDEKASLARKLASVDEELNRIIVMLQAVHEMNSYIGASASQGQVSSSLAPRSKGRRRPRPNTIPLSDPLNSATSQQPKPKDGQKAMMNLDPWAMQWISKPLQADSPVTSFEQLLDMIYPQGWRDKTLSRVAGRGKTQLVTYQDDLAVENCQLRGKLRKTVAKLRLLHADPGLAANLTKKSREVVKILNSSVGWKQFEAFVQALDVR